MSVLRSRIVTPAEPMGDYHPYGTPGTPMVMPLDQVSYDGQTATCEPLHPVWAADGAPYAHTRDGAWGQVVPAGRP
jgi:hypothetical protein